MKYILIKTDGYSIDTTEFGTIDAAINALREDYDRHDPKYDTVPANEVNEDLFNLWSQSILCHTEAILYTGDDVYVWKIISVSPSEGDCTNVS